MRGLILADLFFGPGVETISRFKPLNAGARIYLQEISGIDRPGEGNQFIAYVSGPAPQCKVVIKIDGNFDYAALK